MKRLGTVLLAAAALIGCGGDGWDEVRPAAAEVSALYDQLIADWETVAEGTADPEAAKWAADQAIRAEGARRALLRAVEDGLTDEGNIPASVVLAPIEGVRERVEGQLEEVAAHLEELGK